ncbi:MAG TPA: Ppx/GppA phosphatase family protein [Thermoleophilaceae bacterium]|nr:Ppx/GppA phosphatase family protein [Thermoleophilaceae bacterium]
MAEDPRAAPDTSGGDTTAASDKAKKVGVVDLGTNSTRLLLAEVQDGRVAELERRTVVTRLGEGVETTGRLSEAAVGRVCEALAVFREVLDRLGADEVVAVATSAMRDAENGPGFRDEIRERFGIDARTISGDEEARLTFLGATSDRQAGAETLVIDIGGGSTEYVTGQAGSEPGFHISTRMGSVRHTERHLTSDPPTSDEMASLAEDARTIVNEEVPAEVLQRVEEGIAVAGTATNLAAIAQELDPYDPEKVHGYRLGRGTCERIVAQLAALTVEARRRVTGLHPDRAPTIVAGAVILLESIRSFDLDEIEVSEADILHGAALAAAATERSRKD